MTATRRDLANIPLDIPQGATRLERMSLVTRALWNALQTRTPGDRGISWVGFYLAPGQTHNDETIPDDQMVLAVREPKPACSPIGLHGACGRAFLNRRPLVVTDVANLGEGYVACDPRDLSELVLPCIDDTGRAFAVLDLDSFDRAAFSAEDATAANTLLHRAGLTSASALAATPEVV